MKYPGGSEKLYKLNLGNSHTKHFSLVLTWETYLHAPC